MNRFFFIGVNIISQMWFASVAEDDCWEYTLKKLKS